VVAWFKARRDAEGRPHDPRAAKRNFSTEPSEDLLGATGWLPSTEQSAQPGPSSPKVVMVTQREFALMRSSFPSPNKHKGKKLAEDMDVRSGKSHSVDRHTCVEVYMSTIGYEFILPAHLRQRHIPRAFRAKQHPSGRHHLHSSRWDGRVAWCVAAQAGKTGDACIAFGLFRMVTANTQRCAKLSTVSSRAGDLLIDIGVYSSQSCNVALICVMQPSYRHN